MSAWPDYARIIVSGYQLGQDADVERTTFDDGMVRQARRYSASLQLRTVTAMLDSTARLNEFRAWATQWAHRWFAFADPDDGVVRRVRVRGGVGGIDYQADTLGGVGGRSHQARTRGDDRVVWRAELVLEGYQHDII